MFYNLLNFPEAPPSNRADILKIIIDDYQPDLFMVCELQSQTGANLILNTSLQTSDNRYNMASFVSNQSNTNSNLQQLVYYNSQKLILESQEEIITSVRDINHYLFKLNSSIPVFIDVFVTHLKSSQGSDNVQKRLEMVQDFLGELAQVPTSHYVLFAGDFNFYTSSEDGYRLLLDDANPIILKDPINRSGNWHINSSFEDIHTQSTKTSNSGFGGFGAGGGLDDRFDFILISENLQTDTTLRYVVNSYKAYGNNGNCYNSNINDTNCTGNFSQALRDNLYNMSDHLPVVMELLTDQVLAVTDEDIIKNLIQINNSNITKSKLSLKIDVKLLNEKLIIYNSLGQKVKRISIDTISIDNGIMIDATNLGNGIYYIGVENFTYNKPIKFIKI